jgi:hypothetical protein
MDCSTITRRRQERPAPAAESGQEQVLSLDSIRPSPENAKLYRPVDPKDPEIIALAQSIRQYGLQVPITAGQVKEFELPAQGKAKRTSTNYERFVWEHGDLVLELEAVPPETLQELLSTAIDSVVDVDSFNHELDQEKQDAAFLATARRRAQAALAGIGNSEGSP